MVKDHSDSERGNPLPPKLFRCEKGNDTFLKPTHMAAVPNNFKVQYKKTFMGEERRLGGGGGGSV